jgi:hypothetical protein
MAQSSRRRAEGAGRLVRSLVLIAVLIPVTVLFVQLRDATGEEKSVAEKERHGVTYLTALWQLTVALTDAQAAAVAGQRPADAEALPKAVAAVGRIDERLGDELRSHDRWGGLRTRIEALPDRFADPSAAYTAYTATTEMLLGLFAKVRETSDLIRDPDADAYFLEDAAAEELPEATVAVGRLTDLSLIAPSRPPSQRIATIATLTAVRTAVTDPAGDLAQDLRSAVDSTKSSTLSGSLLGRLDLYQRTMDNFAAVSAPGANEVAPAAAPIGQARTEVQAAAAGLGETIYTELGRLVATRIDSLADRQRFTLATLALAVLLVVTPITVMYLPRRRAHVEEQPPAESQPPVTGPFRRPLVSTSAGPGTEADGTGQPGWGRSGAAR